MRRHEGESNPRQLNAMYSSTTFMRGIDLRLAFAASAALAVSLLVLVTINSPPPPPTSGGDPATGGPMLRTQAITTDELVRRVKAGQISSITVMGDHAVAPGLLDRDRAVHAQLVVTGL